MPKPKYFIGIRVLSWIAVAVIFLAANHNPTQRYSPYQVLVWEIKANEGYRSWWYQDGSARINGKRRISHSIGFGWNDYGGTRRDRIKKYTRDGKVTYKEALDITLLELSRYGKLHSDPYKDIALKLYSYNCGKIKSGNQLGRCHNGKNAYGKRCGYTCLDKRKQQKVRTAHNRRREFELALWRHDWKKIAEFSEMNKAKVSGQYIANKGR